MREKTQLSNKKIMYLITKSNFGGAQKYVYDLALEAKLQGADVSVILGGNGLLIKKLEEIDIKTFQIKELQRDINFISEIKSFFKIYSLIKKNKPDVLHINSSKAGLGALAGRINKTPKIIFTIHGWAFNENRTFLNKLLIKLMYLITILLSHISISVSDYTKKQALAIPFIFLVNKKIKVVKNSVKKINFLSKENARNFFEEKIKIPQNSKIIGVLAELHPIKGLDILLKSAREFFQTKRAENIIFLIVGDGQEKENLQKYIAQNDLENKCFLFGYLDNASKYLKAFDIFILPSLSEAMPLSIIEAGQAELPVIATRVGGIPEIITDQKNGLIIDPNDEKSLIEALNFILLEEKRATEFGLNLKKEIEQNFSFETFYQKTFELY
jgi:glycosyltransferase involved in cell wall biosynthesis